MSFVLKKMAFVRPTAMLVILRKQTMCALSVRRHVKNAMIMITVLNALTAHIFNKYLEIFCVQIVPQDVQAAPINPRAQNAGSQTTGEHTARTTVSIVLVTVIGSMVAQQDVLMGIIRPTMYQKVDMYATDALHPVLLVQICHSVRNAKMVSTGKQTLHVMNVLPIVEMNLNAINQMDLV